MKRTVLILSIVFTILAATVLYGNYGEPPDERRIPLKTVYGAQFPESMSDVAIDPVVGFSIY